MPPPLRIALLWHSTNSGNLGVGALTVANAELVRQAARSVGREVDLVVVGFADPGRPYPQVEELESFQVTGRRAVARAGLARTLKTADVVIDIGAGDSFSDIYGLKRLSYLLASKALTVALGRPLVLAPQTLGPFSSRTAGALAEALVLASRHTFSRDAASVASLRSSRARAKVRVTTDVAFALPYHEVARDNGVTRIGFSVSALLHNGGYRGANDFGLALDYPVFVREVIRELRASDPAADVLLIPHVVNPGMDIEDDLALCRRLAAEAGLPEPPVLSDPVMAKSFISGCSFVMGSRMHACIAAVSAGRATLPIAYSRKFEGLFSRLGYEHTLDARTTSTDEAVAAVLKSYSRRAELEADARAARQRAVEDLTTYTDVLEQVFAELSG